jgi:hypothetical protein
MKPTKKGQIAKFHTALADENPKQLYVVLEVIEDDERPRAYIQAPNTGLSFTPINTVRLDDLEVVEVNTQDLIGHQVTINKSDYSQVKPLDKSSIMFCSETFNAFTITGVETNVWLTIIDKNGIEHLGTLFVTPA